MSTPTPTPTPSSTPTYIECNVLVINKDCNNTVSKSITADTCTSFLLKLDESSLAEGLFDVYNNGNLVLENQEKQQLLDGVSIYCYCTPTPTPTNTQTPTPSGV